MPKRKAEEPNNTLGETITRNFQLVSSVNEKFWDMWMVNLGSMSWLNEQWENMVETYLSQRKTMREEFINVAEEMASQIQKNLSQVEEVVKEGWVASAENVNLPSFPGMKNYVDLVKQMDDLTKKMTEK
ncbi:MAG: hypothetical protein ACM3UZ_10495 [Acidobacteriota bacterium]